MSRLIEIDPQIDKKPEEDGYEFGYYAFDILPLIEVQEIDDNGSNDESEDIPNFQ